MADPYDLRLTQSTFPGWDIDGTPGTTSPDAGNDMQDQIVAQVVSAQLPITELIAPIDLSQAVEAIVQANPNPDLGTPAKPSKPVVTGSPSALVVAWDGKNADGTDSRTPDWDHLAVHVSTVSGFIPDDTTMKASIHATQAGVGGQAVVSTRDYGVTQYVRFVAVSRSGKASAPSEQTSGSPFKIDALDVGQFALFVTNMRDDKHHLY